MTTAPREQICELLSEIGAPGAFTARRTAAVENLHLEIKDVGQLRFPVPKTQARQLCRVARLAHYGRGEKTFLDRRVRDTWEIPKSRVKIDRRRWNQTLRPVLEALRGDLGLPDGCKLEAELHSLLVYAPGQFFLPHQDSEKSDDMVGTLVVTLPSPFKGGALVIEHQGERITSRAPNRNLSFIAFYADCHHEVQPVKEGYRIVLTYNLHLAGDAAAAEPPPATVEALAEGLRAHFETPLPPRYEWQRDMPPREPPDRLVYLLDHQYTERGLGWQRLKGNDAARAAALEAAAERAGCETVLALADVHEVWSCMEPGWDEPWHGRHRRWGRYGDDEGYEDDEPPAVDDPDAYTLEDLQDWSLELTRWIEPSKKRAEPVATSVSDDEVCSTTPSSELEPYASEYEGHMGNWGNTMDRWYRRAAVVLWPREKAFAVRAEASPFWALGELERRLRAGEGPETQRLAAALLPIWKDVAPQEERRGFFGKSLRVAEGLDEPELAAALLRPFRVEVLTPKQAPAFVALVEHYGESWSRSLITEWSNSAPAPMRLAGRDQAAWIAEFPRLCEALRAAKDAVGVTAALLLLRVQWERLKELIEEGLGLESPSWRDQALTALAKPILGFLESSAVAGGGDLRDEAIAHLGADENGPLLSCLIKVLRLAAETAMPARRTALGFEALHRHCIRRLEVRLAVPERAVDDWSIALPRGCRCELCGTLATFLAAPDQRRLEWPLAKERRLHIHRRLDAHELPVEHHTRRTGRPYTLILSKTKALFEREAAERRCWEKDLEWLTGLGG